MQVSLHLTKTNECDLGVPYYHLKTNGYVPRQDEVVRVPDDEGFLAPYRVTQLYTNIEDGEVEILIEPLTVVDLGDTGSREETVKNELARSPHTERLLRNLCDEFLYGDTSDCTEALETVCEILELV